MEFTGRLVDMDIDYKSLKYKVTFEINEKAVIRELEAMEDNKLSIKVSKFRHKRSLDANGLLWVCLGQIAEALRTDKWVVYLQMLKRYGKFTYICVKPNVVDAVKQQWRECEVIGNVNINGQESVQMLCYFGSSTYDSKEFSVLLDGVISEMRELGLQTPTSEEMKWTIEQWEKQNQ